MSKKLSRREQFSSFFTEMKIPDEKKKTFQEIGWSEFCMCSQDTLAKIVGDSTAEACLKYLNKIDKCMCVCVCVCVCVFVFVCV